MDAQTGDLTLRALAAPYASTTRSEAEHAAERRASFQTECAMIAVHASTSAAATA
jgi:hypothetical protein